MLARMSNTLIATPEELHAYCQKIANSTWLAIDTEFLREKTYYARLCLIQVYNGEHLACIDTLAIDDLEPLLQILDDTRITKVLHAAFQDLEIFYQLGHRVPAPIFDTQIAAALLAKGYQVSYGALVQQLLNVELDKSHSRTDWSRRPLSDAQLEYAANDVLYLGDIYLRLKESLITADRLHWLEEDDHLLSDPQQYQVHSADVWQRVKAKEVLSRQQLAVLQALAAWREQRAMRIDRPRRWVMSDEILIALAQTDGSGLPADLPVNDKFREQFGAQIGDIIRQALTLPEDKWPELNIRPRPDATEKRTLKTLMQLVEQTAERINVEPAMLSNRKAVTALYHGASRLPFLDGWRKAVIGDALEAKLAEMRSEAGTETS